MTEFVLGSYRLEVDVEATRAWYGRYGNATGGCGCAYCRNYAAAVGVLPPEAAAFLEPLGLNLRRPGDIGEYGPRQGGRWYMPMWHIAGRLLEAGELRVCDVAQECGFPDEFYFSRVFRQTMGCAPGEYRDRAARTRAAAPDYRDNQPKET